MTGILYVGALVCCIAFYINHVSLLKNIRDNRETSINTIIGVICLLVIYLAIISFH